MTDDTPTPLPDDTPPAAVEVASVEHALVLFQADLPDIAAAQTAKVEKDGRTLYTYQYADLADVSRVVLRRLGALGCAWITVPSSGERGVTLSYRLVHAASHTAIAGEWFIGTGDPQQIGSRITYARRYALLAVTGVFPAGEDDDGARGAQERPAPQRRERREEQPAQQRQQTARPVQPQAAPASPPASPPAADQGVPGPQTRAAEQQALRDSVQRAQQKAGSLVGAVPAIDQKASVAAFIAGDPLFPTAQLTAAADLFAQVQQEGTTGWRHLGSGPSLLDVWETRLCAALGACTNPAGVRRVEALIERAGMRKSHPKLKASLIDAYGRVGVDPLGHERPAE